MCQAGKDYHKFSRVLHAIKMRLHSNNSSSSAFSHSTPRSIISYFFDFLAVAATQLPLPLMLLLLLPLQMPFALQLQFHSLCLTAIHCRITDIRQNFLHSHFHHFCAHSARLQQSKGRQ